MNMGANFLGHVLLGRLLAPNLRAAAAAGVATGVVGGRIVHVSSSMHKDASAASLLSDPMCERSYGIFAAYSKSKLAQVLYVREEERREARRAHGADADDVLTYVSCHPGNVQTEVSRNFPTLLHQLYVVMQPLLRCAQPGLSDAASTPVYAVAAPERAQLGGLYLERSAPVPANPDAGDEAAARQLYEFCEEQLRPWLASSSCERPGRGRRSPSRARRAAP
jgi:NAD(P)-dependent dehydrogenase (short-subunit alcohol dehydrogenase family)